MWRFPAVAVSAIGHEAIRPCFAHFGCCMRSSFTYSQPSGHRTIAAILSHNTFLRFQAQGNAAMFHLSQPLSCGNIVYLFPAKRSLDRSSYCHNTTIFYVSQPLPCSHSSPVLSQAVIGSIRLSSYRHFSVMSGMRRCSHVSPISAIIMRPLSTCFQRSGHWTIPAVVIRRPFSRGFRREAMRPYSTYSSHYNEPCDHEGFFVIFASCVKSFQCGKRRHLSAKHYIYDCSTPAYDSLIVFFAFKAISFFCTTHPHLHLLSSLHSRFMHMARAFLALGYKMRICLFRPLFAG